MPNDNAPHQVSLGKIRQSVLNHNKTSKWKRLRSLQGIIRPFATDKDKSRLTGQYNCAKWSHTDGYGINHPVEIAGDATGQVSVRGVKVCRSRDCPNCAGIKRAKDADQISMSVMGTLLDGGQCRLVTTTKAPEVDDLLSIRQVKAYASKAAKVVKNYNYYHGTKIGYHLVIEPSFSRKVIGSHHKIEGYHNKKYIHLHTHSLVLLSNEDSKHEDSLMEKLKKCWKDCVSENDGYSFLQQDKNHLRSRAFRVDVIEGEKGLGKYLNKNLGAVENIGLETEMGQSKGETVKGRGLFVVLDDIINSDDKQSQAQDIEMLRNWYSGMFGARRARTNEHFKNAMASFERHREEKVRRWCEAYVAGCQSADFIGRCHSSDGDILNAQFETWMALPSEPHESAPGAEYIWKATEMSPRILNKREVLWTEFVSGAFWDSISKKGLFGLLQELFRGYHMEGKYRIPYEFSKRIDERSLGREIGGKTILYDGLDQFLELCYNDGILYRDKKGSKFKLTNYIGD